MADRPVVIFDSVWKKFRRGERHDSLRDLVPAAVKRLFKRPPPRELMDQEFWAIQNVSFEVRPGEALGIIGPNGAGKSTALKLLTKILRPTRGNAEIRGRVGALIEVAAGFHPDLTGRENIYLQGAVMGMKRMEISARLDSIVEFAGMGDFIDTPVKRYSSGMNARLGFSIAAHLRPDALIIDEVLSVGDMPFQQKCVSRMMQFKQEGVAIVFVSHNLQAVSMLCEQATFLQARQVAVGATDDVVQAYIRHSQTMPTALGDTDVRIVPLGLVDHEGRPARSIAPGAALTLRVAYDAARRPDGLTFGFLLYRSTDNLLVYDGNVPSRELWPSGGEAFPAVLEFTFRPRLTRGHYYVVCHVWEDSTQRFLARLSPAVSFSVEENRTYSGIVDIDLRTVLVDAAVDVYGADLQACTLPQA